MCRQHRFRHLQGQEGVDVSEREPLSVEAAQQLLIEGQSLPVEGNLLAALQHSLDLVQDWESRLAEGGQETGAHSESAVPCPSADL